MAGYCKRCGAPAGADGLCAACRRKQSQADVIMFGRRPDTRRCPARERIRGTVELQGREYELDGYLTPVDED